MTSNFFVKKEDIDNNTRAEATQRGLIEMNNSVIILIYKGELSNSFSILNDYHIIIITEIINMEMSEALNEYCKEKKIAFIYTAQFGLSSFLFKDFGNDFIVKNANGKENQKYFIKSISNSCPGIVEIDPIETYKNRKKVKKFIELGTGDFVAFKNVKGMIELNDTPPRPIRVLSKTKFTIEDTSKFQEFSGSGVVEEVKIPYPMEYKTLSEAKDFIYDDENIEEEFHENFNCDIISDENIISKENEFPWEKLLLSYNKDETLQNKPNEIMHLSILSLHEFFKIHQFLPHYNEPKEISECIEISSILFSEAKKENKKWVKNLEKIDKIFLEKIFKFSRFYFSPMTNFLGGVISQEILKYIGLYKPSQQWIYFNFLELINDDILKQNFKNEIIDEEFKRNRGLYILFGKEKINEIKNTNILIIGLNDTGFEIVRIFLMLNLYNENNNNITIIEKNEDEIEEKINNLKINDKFYNLNIIKEKINIKENISEKIWWKNSTIIIDTLSYENNLNEKMYIIKNSEKDNKILISINTSKTIGSYELILPNQILNNYSQNKKNSFSSNEDIEETPEDEIEEENIKPNFIYTMKDAINWSKNFFEDNFKNNIKYLNDLINKSDSEEEMKKYMDDLISKINDNKKVLKLIRYFKKLISLKLSLNFESIVFHSIELFQEIFEFSIDEILQKYPKDLMDEDTCKKFWSGKMVEPTKIKFDINNEEHYKLIYYFTYFFCQILEMEKIDEKMEKIHKIGEKYQFKIFDLTILKKANNQDFFDIEKNSIIKFLGDILKINKLNFKEIDINYFENIKNIENFKEINKQIKLVILASNIKLINFGLNITNKNNGIYQLLKINEVFPTVSSSISGLTLIQIFNMFNDFKFFDFIKSVKEGKIKNEINNKIKENDNPNKIIMNDGEDNNISFYKNSIFNFASNIYISYDIISFSN